LSQVKQNIRIRFSEEGDIRFISHHDLMRLFERALRRAALPLAMSEGFNPRPRMSFPAALSVGHTGRNEVADFGLAEWIRPEEFAARLAPELPDGVSVLSVEITGPHPTRQPKEVSYLVPLLPDHRVTEQTIHELLAKEQATVTRLRKGQEGRIEIRRFVKALRLEGDSVRMLLAWGDGGTAKPEEVLEALGCQEGVDYAQSAIERTHVNLSG